jgi:hypothetical protein
LNLLFNISPSAVSPSHYLPVSFLFLSLPWCFFPSLYQRKKILSLLFFTDIGRSL